MTPVMPNASGQGSGSTAFAGGARCWWLGRVLPLVLAACGGGGRDGADSAAPPPTVPPPVADSVQRYFPLWANGSWYFEGAGGEPLYMRITGSRLSGSSPFEPYEIAIFVPAEVPEPAQPLRGAYYDFDADGLYEVALPWGWDEVRWAIGPIRILPFPVMLGQRWLAADRVVTDLLDADGDERPDTLHLRAEGEVLGVADEVFAGVTLANVVHVRRDETRVVTLAASGERREERRTVEEWFAPDIGLVRIRISTPSLGTVADYRLQAWRVGQRSSEAVPPRIVGVSPAEGEIQGEFRAVVAFDGPMLATPSYGLAGILTVLDPEGRFLTNNLRTRWLDARRLEVWFDFSSPPSGEYTLSLLPGWPDAAGNALESGLVHRVRVDGSAPVVLSSIPESGARDLPLRPVLRVVFNEPLDPARLQVKLTASSSSGTPIPVNIELSGGELTVQPVANLEEGTFHSLSVEGAADAFGHTAARFDLSFRTDPGRFASPERNLDANTWMQVPITAGSGGRPGLVVDDAVVGSGIVQAAVRFHRAWPDGPGAEPPQIVLFPAGEQILIAAAGELDGDGREDLAVAGCGPSSCTLWGLRHEGGSLAAPAQLATLPWVPSQLQALDLPGQPRDALLFSATEQVPIRLLPASGGGYATPEPVPDVVAGGRELLAGDVDGDGIDDLVVVNDYNIGGPQWSVHRQSAAGTLSRTHLGGMPEGWWMSAFTLADLNADGRADWIVIAGAAGNGARVRLMVALGQPDGSLGALQSLTPTLEFPIGQGFSELVAADVDGDGRLDLIGATQSQFALWLQAADGSWPLPRWFERRTTGGGSGRLWVADINGDGLLDVQMGAHFSRQRPPAEYAAPGGD